MRNNYPGLTYFSRAIHTFMRSSHLISLALLALLVLPCLSWLSGCAAVARHEHAAALNQALQDDQTCQTQGWHYPAPRYVTCRMQLDDQRQHRNWMNLQIMKQTQSQRAGAPPTYPEQEAYRPLDRDQYQCHYTSENGKDYILCGEITEN